MAKATAARWLTRLRRRLNGRRRRLNGWRGAAETGDCLPDLHRRVEDLADRQAALEFVAPDRLEPGRRDASAVRAVRVAAELTGRDPPFQVRREAVGRLREDAFVRRLRRRRID